MDVPPENAPNGPQTCDLAVVNGHILTLDSASRVYRDGAIAVIGNQIAAVGPTEAVLASYQARSVIDANGAPVHPGFIDGHIHPSQHTSRGFDSLLAGNPQCTVNFATWKAELQYEDEYASTALVAIDLLRNGYTGFVDGGTTLEPDSVADAAMAVGIRAWIPDPYLWDRSDILECVPRLISPALGRRAPFNLDHSMKTLGSQLYRNRDPDTLVRGYVALYGLGTASDTLHKAAKEAADQAGVVCGQHVGYVRGMSEWEEARLGRPALVHLTDLGVLDRNSMVVHLNVLQDSEIDPLAGSGASVVWCPAGYLYFAARDGLRSRVPELHKRGINVALGVDTPKTCSVSDTGSFALHAAAASGHALSGNDIFVMLSKNAAGAIGAGDELGSLEPGKRADIVIRTEAAADAQPGLDPVFQLSVLGRGTSVDTVLVDGAIVLRHGRPTKISEDVVFGAVKKSMDAVTKRLGLVR